MTTRFGITYYASLFDAAGVFRPCSPSALSRWLSSPKPFVKKSEAARWAAFRSRGGRRRREDIVDVFALVYDVDAPIALDVLADALGEVHTFIASTWSATAEAPRWRIVVFLDRPIAPAEHPRVWRAGAELLERVAAPDVAAKDATHIWSTPAMQPGGFFACRETTGAELAVDEALARFPEEAPIAPADPPDEIRSVDAYARGALSRAVADVQSAQRGARAYTLNAAADPIARFISSGQLHEDEVVCELVAAATATGMPRTEALGIVRRSIRSYTRRSA